MGLIHQIKKYFFNIFDIDIDFVPSPDYYNFIKQGHSRKKARELSEKQRRKRLDIENEKCEQKEKSKRKAEIEKYIKKYLKKGYSKNEAIKKGNSEYALDNPPGDGDFQVAFKYYINKGYSRKEAIRKAKYYSVWMGNDGHWLPAPSDWPFKS